MSEDTEAKLRRYESEEMHRERAARYNAHLVEWHRDRARAWRIIAVVFAVLYVTTCIAWIATGSDNG